MFASLLGASFEGFIVDNEMLGMVQRVIRGIEVSEDTIGLPVIEDVVYGPGHFLGHDQTIGAMERDYLYPDLADRNSPDAWSEEGGSDMWERAKTKALEILNSHFPGPVDAAADTRIRANYPILLPRERLTSYP